MKYSIIYLYVGTYHILYDNIYLSIYVLNACVSNERLTNYVLRPKGQVKSQIISCKQRVHKNRRTCFFYSFKWTLFIPRVPTRIFVWKARIK